MASLDFPASPTNGQEYTSGTTTWQYNSAKGYWFVSTVDSEDVDTILNTATATTGQRLYWNGSDYDWIDQQTLQDTTDAGATTTNAVTMGNLTSTGIDDNATSTKLTITDSGIAATLTTAAQPNITSVGTLTGFTSTGIDDNATSTAITITDSGIAATLTTAAQPNITSVGTLTGFTSTGIDDNATSTAVTIDSSGNVTATGNVTVDQFISLANGARMTVSTGNPAFTDFLGGSTDNTSDDGLFAFYGGRAYNQGAGVVVYGDDHATWPNEIRFVNGAFVERFVIEADGTASFQGGIKETVYTNATVGASFALDPSNGTIQNLTLSASSTFSDSLSTGEYITLHILDGTAYTITWPTMEWTGGSAPTLDTTNETIINVWKVGSVLYGALVGVSS
jgi:hypothetical protein